MNGASPLTRGKLALVRGFARAVRRIPAHAGKTRVSTSSACRARAHPRSRGENHVLALLQVHLAGASPLTRGKRTTTSRRSMRWGRIPAHAGKTARLPHERCRGPAHPRSRGENLEAIAGKIDQRGASPLTRGKRQTHRTIALLPGRIPAHAGKTPSRPGYWCRGRAHPRSRGENRDSTASRLFP